MKQQKRVIIDINICKTKELFCTFLCLFCTFFALCLRYFFQPFLSESRFKKAVAGAVLCKTCS